MQKKTDLESQIDRLSDASRNTEERIQSIKELFIYMHSLRDGDELFRLRLKLRDNVRRIIGKIDIFPPESKITTSEYEDVKKYVRGNSLHSLLDLKVKDVIFLQMHFIVDHKKTAVQGIHFDIKRKEVISRWWLGDSIPRFYRRLNYL